MKWLAYDPLNKDLVPGTLFKAFMKEYKNKIIVKNKTYFFKALEMLVFNILKIQMLNTMLQ